MSVINLKLRAKLTLIFGSLAAVALLAAGITFLSFNQINGIRAKILSLHLADKSRIAADNNFLLFMRSPDTQNLSRLSGSINELEGTLTQFRDNPLRNEDILIVNEMLKNVNTYKTSAQSLSEISKTRASILSEANLLTEQIATDFPESAAQIYQARFLGQRFISTTKADDYSTWQNHVNMLSEVIDDPSYRAMANRYTELGNQCWQAIENSNGIYNNMISAANSLNANLTNLVEGSEIVFNGQRSRNITFIITILLFLIVGSGTIAVIFSKKLSANISRGVRFAEIIASGDLTVKLDNDLLAKQDEIGDLARSLNNMGDVLKGITDNIVEGAERISQASIQFNSTSQQISKSSNEQASSAEEISSSMEQMAANIDQTSDNSKQAEKVASETETGVVDGVEAASKALEFVTQISDKITIIRDIAFQTNILALNAAVEAARAGEHGKGFAVVAAEVRKLAERSAVSAQDIETMANRLSEASDNASIKLKDVIPKVKDNLKLIQEISAASLEQASGADQVNNAIQHLNKTVQDNVTVSEELASNATEMKDQSDKLVSAISFFRTSEQKG
ncbi:MAG TPA: HAMP domain-containing methyl-accepting chemotaxis protein [Tenuifilaceae bacterium]|nr:HAMP domain-containing methyl-accepting chemotaxis protein [Tenuifilaceae bacterium]